MSEKRGRSSLPPKPPPPPSTHAPPPPPPPQSQDTPPPVPSHSSPLTNGGSPAEGKPKPPNKPFKLTRAFSSGSLPSFSKISKAGRRKSKNLEALSNETENETEITSRNENEPKGNGNEDMAPRKLPGIGTAPKLQSRTKPDSVLHNSSPIPKPEGADTNKDQLEFRQLPPIPNHIPESAEDESTDQTLAPPAPPVTSDSKTPAESSVNSASPSRNANTSPSPSRDDVNIDPGPGFRPLPPTPTLSDDEDDPTPSVDNSHTFEEENGATYEQLDDTKPEAAPSNVPTSDPTAKESGINVGTPPELHHKSSDTNDDLHSSTKETNSVSSSKSSLTPTPANTHDEQHTEEVQSYTVSDIINTYSYALPVRVRILQGYCSDTTEVNISTDDIYNIHSAQHVKKIMVKDEDGMTHCISIDAPVKIGLIYNPDNDLDKSLNGYVFKTVSEITTLPNLPKLICAQQTVSTGDDKNSVTEGEIFVVKSIHRSMFKGKKGLKVYSLATKSSKVLLEDCQGSFSTSPSLVRMGLTELLEGVGEVFPSRAVIYPTSNESKTSDFPGTLSRVVTLLESNSDTTLVVSDVSFLDDTELEEANVLPVPATSPASFSLLLDDDISKLEIAVLRWTYPEDQDPDNLYDDTTEIGANVDESDINSHSSRTEWDGDEEASQVGMVNGEGEGANDHTYVNLQQTQQLKGSVSVNDLTDKEKMYIEEDEDAGYDTVGLHLLRDRDTTPPPSIAEATPPTNHGYSSIRQNRKSKDEKTPPFPSHKYSTLNQNKQQKGSQPPANNGYSTVHPHQTLNGVVVEVPPSPEVTGIKGAGQGGSGGTPRKVSTTVTQQEDQLAAMMESFESRLKLFQTTQQSAEMTKMQTMLEKLATKLEAVDAQLSSPQAASSTPSAQAANVATKGAQKEVEGGAEGNREYLKSLDVDQVGQLLEAMSLGQYKQKILEEQISGEILLECDESILVEEVGVVSRIHRIRLMKVIRGESDIRVLLQK